MSDSWSLTKFIVLVVIVLTAIVAASLLSFNAYELDKCSTTAWYSNWKVWLNIGFAIVHIALGILGVVLFFKL